MCGIAGEFVYKGSSVLDEENIVPMVTALAHRGPDDWGYYLSPDRRALLLHTRLSIIDLEGGKQPLSNEDGTIWVSFNGEIYDYQNLIKDLEQRGHRFKTQSDTETIVHLYEEYGEDFLRHLRGEFAIVLFDQRQGVLYLIRDRFGIKPLYYMEHGDSILFASELKAILAHAGTSTRFDPGYIHALWCGFWLASDSIFAGMKQVEPGCYLKFSGGRYERHRYWDLPLVTLAEEAEIAASRSEDDLCQEFLALLKESIRLRLVADVDVGIYLSGGFDSSAIASIIAQQLHQRVSAFTIGFTDPAFDETPIARSVADLNQLDMHQISIGRGQLRSHFVASVWHAETPVPMSNGAAKYLLSDLARQHVKVVLTGEGSDELLCGYKHFKHQLLLDEVQRNPSSRALRGQVRGFLSKSAHLPYMAPFTEYQDYDRVTQLFGNYPYTALRYFQFRKKTAALLSRDVLEASQIDPLDRLAGYIGPQRLAGLSTLAATQYVHFKTDLPVFLLGYLGDREEMAHSIEGRLPFLDHKLVEFGCRLPSAMKLQQNTEKYILRRAVGHMLPPSMKNLEKRMFLAPTKSTLALDRHDSEFDHYLSTSYTQEVGLFKPRVIKLLRFINRFAPRGSIASRRTEEALTLVLSFHVLHELFIKNFRPAMQRFQRAPYSFDLRAHQVH